MLSLSKHETSYDDNLLISSPRDSRAGAGRYGSAFFTSIATV